MGTKVKILTKCPVSRGKFSENLNLFRSETGLVLRIISTVETATLVMRIEGISVPK